MELLEQVRRGDEAAFTELFVRHRAVARRVALTYRCPGDPDDLVNEAFEKVFAAVRRGSGPTDAFRAYLLVTMRRLAADHSERPKDESLEDVPEAVAAAASEPPLDTEDRELITKAFESLPDRWQAVLWYTAVEGRHPRELAPLLGVSANAVSALAYRAREQLRQAFLQAHLQTWARPQCEPHRSLLGAYVREGQSRRERAATQRHLDHCPSCQNLVVELNEVNSLLVRSVVPLFPASLIAAKVGAATAGAAGAAGAASAGGGGALTAAAETGAHLARRTLGTLAWFKEAGTAAGGLAAATGLLVGLAGLGAYVAGEDKTPEVAMLTQNPEVSPDTTVAPTTTAPPASPPPSVAAARQEQPCPEVSTDDEGAEGDADTAEDAATDDAKSPLASLDVDVPALNALGDAAPDIDLDVDALCSPGEDRSELTIGVGAGDEAADTGTTIADVDLEVLDLSLSVKLGTGATALDVGLPEICDLLNGGQEVSCALDDLTDADIGLVLDTAGQDAGATITLRQGDKVIDVKTVEVLGAVEDLTGGLLGPLLGGGTTTIP
ncbi:MAG TPA: sigma-70 family RNA polymerase sigma factor [Acidimicrobiales bacterium]|nr:sigma-70 family RNA polymerase sigma factor [Acidimicrobiales bacterium]